MKELDESLYWLELPAIFTTIRKNLTFPEGALNGPMGP